MVPKDQFIPVRREILGAVFDKAGQRGGIRHGGGTCVLHQSAQLAAVLDLVDLVYAAADHIVFPLGRAAGIDDQVHIVAQGRFCHFHQVCCTHPAL